MTHALPAAAAAPSRTVVLARAAIVAIFFVSGGVLGVWAAHLPLLKAGLGLDDAELGLVLLAMGGGAVVGMPLTGVLLHRFGAVAVTVVSGVLLTLALALPALAPLYVCLIGAALLLGALIGGMDVAMNAHAAAIEAAFGRPIMSSIHAFFSIGGLAGAAGAGALIALDTGAAAGMAIAAVVLLVIVAVAATKLALPGATGRETGGHALKLPSAAVLGLGAVTLLAFLCEGAMIDWSAVYMVQALGAGAALAAYGYAAFSAAMTFGRLTGDRVVARLGPLRTVQASGAVAAVGLALVIAAPSPWVAFAGFVVTGLGLANVVPVLFSAATRIPGVAPEMGIAMVATMAYGGGLMGPPLIGFLGHAVGLRAAFVLLAAAALVVALGVGRALRRG